MFKSLRDHCPSVSLYLCLCLQLYENVELEIFIRISFKKLLLFQFTRGYQIACVPGVICLSVMSVISPSTFSSVFLLLQYCMDCNETSQDWSQKVNYYTRLSNRLGVCHLSVISPSTFSSKRFFSHSVAWNAMKVHINGLQQFLVIAVALVC